jgi:hypothetical protein
MRIKESGKPRAIPQGHSCPIRMVHRSEVILGKLALLLKADRAGRETYGKLMAGAEILLDRPDEKADDLRSRWTDSPVI